MSSLNVRAWISLVVLEVVLAAGLFLCAGTTRYRQGWIYLLLLFLMAAGITLDLMRRDPALLERRMKGGPGAEPRPLQRFLMLGASQASSGSLSFRPWPSGTNGPACPSPSLSPATFSSSSGSC